MKAAREDPSSTRAFSRLYSAGIKPDPAFTNPEETRFPDALSGLGIEQRLIPMREAVRQEEGDERRWKSLILILAIIEGRLRPVGHGIAVLHKIISGDFSPKPDGEPLRPIHEGIRDQFYEERNQTYPGAEGGKLDRKEPILADFEASRAATRQVLKNEENFTSRERGGLRNWQGLLRQSLRPIEEREGGNINYPNLRHAIAHMNIGLDEERTILDRGKVMHAFLEGNRETTVVSLDENGLWEVVKEAWRLMGITWSWQLALNSLDLWLSSKVFPDTPYPQENPHAAGEDTDYHGRAAGIVAGIMASQSGG